MIESGSIMNIKSINFPDAQGPGLLWVSRDGVVRHANAHAVACTGLVSGRSLYDVDLCRAVAAVAKCGEPRTVATVGLDADDGCAFPELVCRVVPGTGTDDVFVLIDAAPATGSHSACDQVLKAVRTDLGAPLKQVQAALSLCNDVAPNRAVHALLDRLEELTLAMDKLMGLANLYGDGASGSPMQASPLWSMLQQAWDHQQSLALEHGVKARFHARGEATLKARVPGNAAALQRALDECLESAIEAAPRGSTLDIEHRLTLTGTQVVLFDCRAFAGADEPGARAHGAPATLGLRSAADSAEGMSAREMISFNLCRHVFDQHAGQMRVEYHQGRRHLVIDLPTEDRGAAVVSATPAQHHARKLAAAMRLAAERSAECIERSPWSTECSAFSSSKTSPTYAS
jgi:hypothetical protein